MILSERALETLALVIVSHLSADPYAFEDKEMRRKLCDIVNDVVDTLLLPENSELAPEHRDRMIQERRRIFALLNARV